MKIEYVREQLAHGIAYPDLFPHWHFGSQILRYYAPLPYLLVIWIANLSELPLITALQWLIALCAWVGALLWLPYRRWIGILQVALGGLLFLVLPDNMRVAFAEGNYPRMVTTALLPLLFYPAAARPLARDKPSPLVLACVDVCHHHHQPCYACRDLRRLCRVAGTYVAACAPNRLTTRVFWGCRAGIRHSAFRLVAAAEFKQRHHRN